EQLQATGAELSRANDHLEAEVAKRTAELREAHLRLVKLEKEATELQMAGGFAHEMRNALAAALMYLASADRGQAPGLCAENNELLREMVCSLKEWLSPEEGMQIAVLLK